MTDRAYGQLSLGGEPTYTVSQLGEELRELLATAYGAIWVTGEIHRIRNSPRGHLYFELVEKGAGDRIVGKIDAVLWRTDHLRVRRILRGHQAELGAGQTIRCRVEVDYYPPMGRLQLAVRDVDPLFTLGLLARRRAETLAALDRAGLLETNRSRTLDDVPLRLALITSADSAAYHDLTTGLANSGYGFETLLLPATVQGERAESEIVAAFRRVERLVAGTSPWQPAAVLLVRGGGARTDLAVFDSRAVAEAVARCSLPVLTGLGHETDRAVADLVAHRAFATPTRVAAFLVERITSAEHALLESQAAVVAIAHRRLDAARAALGRGERIARTARHRLDDASARLRDAGRSLELVGRGRLRQAGRALSRAGDDLRRAAPRLLERRRRRPEQQAQRIADRAQARLDRLDAIVRGHARLCAELSPERILARGFSITRNAAGEVLRDAATTRAGEILSTRLESGTIASTVVTREN